MKKRTSRKLFIVLLISCAAFSFSVCGASLVSAGEGYGSHYAGGQEDLFMGFMGPPGTSLFQNYVLSYIANNLKDNAGRDAKLLSRFPVNFKTQVLVEAMRYNWTSHMKLLGGDVGFQVIVPMGYQHTAMNAGVINMARDTKTSLGDIEVGAAIGWHPAKTFHHLAAVEVIAPTGAYDKDDASNLGRNYWSFAPQYLFSYVGDMNSPIPGLEVGAKLAYQINTINTATSYTSGQEFIADYVVAQHLGKTWALGVNGSYLYQTTNDKQHGRTAVDPISGLRTGVNSKYFSIGPLLTYYLPFKEGSAITVKYQFDVWEQNRPEGNKLWVHFSWPFL